MVTYRLIGAGTVEEKVYEKQVFKDGLRRTLLCDSSSSSEGGDIHAKEASVGDGGWSDRGGGGGGSSKEYHRYFSKNELRRVFELGPPMR